MKPPTRGVVRSTMQIRKLLTDDRAVSPVIGVILMVAITVILAAVIGTFVLGLGSSVQQTTPQAQFGHETNASAANGYRNVTITHETGDSIDAAQVTTTGSFGNHGDIVWSNKLSDSKITAGDSIEVMPETGSTVRTVWDSPESDNTATLAKFEVPS